MSVGVGRAHAHNKRRWPPTSGVSRLTTLSQGMARPFPLCLLASRPQEKVAPGDVIYVEASSGAVKRVGRCDAYATEFDLEADEYVPLPKVRGRTRVTGRACGL